MRESRGCGTRPDAGCEGSFAVNVAGLVAVKINEITIKVYIPQIYNVNTSLMCEY